MKYYNHFGNMITNDTRRTHEIINKTEMAQSAFNKKTIFARQLNLNLRKKLVEFHIWNISFYGTES